jgi:hypothetical protein
MSLKRSLALIGVSLAILALPAAAGADEWYTTIGAEKETVALGEENAAEVEFEGPWSVITSNIESGPCQSEWTLNVWNEIMAGGKSQAQER